MNDDGEQPDSWRPEDQELLRRLANDLLGSLDELCEFVSGYALRHNPRLALLVDPAGLDALAQSTTANVGTVLSTLAFGVPVESIEPPEGVLELVDRIACDPDGLPTLLRTYRLGAAATWRRLAEHLGAHAPDVPTLTRLVLVASAHVYDYTDHISQCLVARWAEVSQEMDRTGRRQEALLRALLRGDPVDLQELRHPLGHHHVAVAARAAPTAGPSALNQALAEIRAHHTRSQHVELVEPDGTHLLWLSSAARPTRIEQIAKAPPGVHLAVSDVASGHEGFVLVAREATDTLRALTRLRPDGGACTYRDQALAATLLADLDRAQRLAQIALGPLAEPGPHAARLRETLQAYFACHENKAAAAARLHVHEKTVAYRLRRASELLNGPIESRRAELEVALLAFTPMFR